jgi:excinuclease ABC subunit C
MFEKDKGGIPIYLKEKVRTLPTSPGVYLMKDSTGHIIYVGKAVNLKRRVQSYFQNSKAHSQKVVKLVHNIKDFDFILTDTEFEAFLLECHLIKELKPHFNKKMKSPQAYPYLVIEMDKEYPIINVTSTPNHSKHNLYFGPYMNKHSVAKAIQGLKEFFKIQCGNPSNKSSACLNVTLGLCIGICTGSAKEQYHAIINRIIALLNGTDISILEEMKQRMTEASDNFDFETALKYRDLLHLITHLVKKEKVIEFTEKNHNIIVIETLHDSTIKLFLIKGNKIIFNEKVELSDERLKADILTYFKLDTVNPTNKVTKDELDESQIIYSYLKGSNCAFLIIPDEWLEDENSTDLNKELSSLFKKN